MKRLLASALLVSVSAFSLAGLVGCDQTAKVEDKKVETTPGGSTTTKTTVEATKSGDHKE